jgi:hypothetical protein
MYVCMYVCVCVCVCVCIYVYMYRELPTAHSPGFRLAWMFNSEKVVSHKCLRLKCFSNVQVSMLRC